MTYLLTVIMPTYNVEDSIRDSVESIKNQTIGFENIELIIVDDNSSDNTKNILNNYSEKYPNIRCLFHKDNSGNGGKGRNEGIELAEGKYIMFLDADDRFTENACKVAYEKINEFGVDILIFNKKVIKNGNFPKNLSLPQDYSYIMDNPKKNEALFKKVNMWDKIFNREFLIKNEIRCLEDCHAEDIYFSIKSFLNTDNVVYLKNFYGIFYNIRDSDNNSSISNTITKSFFLKTLEGFYKIVDLLKKEGRDDLIQWFLKNYFVNLISYSILLNEPDESKINIFNELYNFKKYSGLDYDLNERWSNVFNKNLEKKNFKKLLLISKILKQLYKFNVLREFYRNSINKFNSN